MAKQRGTWIYQPARAAGAAPSAAIKAELQARANELVESVLKPRHVQPPPEQSNLNYIVDLYTKWYRAYLYFRATYRSPGPNAIGPSFEARFARLEYLAKDRFNLAFMRHTNQWQELYQAITLEECLAAIRDEPFFIP